MSYKLLVKKLMIESKKLVTREEIKEYSSYLKISYESAIGHLLSNRYLDRIFRGIFYVNDANERQLGKSKMTFYEILKEALKIKGVEKWYFGLETALKFNNLTHEYFTIDFIISDKLKRPNPMKIRGHKVRFISVKKDLLLFGIKKSSIPYSDTEKTVLDIIYLGNYNGLTGLQIKNKIIDYLPSCNKNKLSNYAKKYPKTVLNFLEELNEIH